MSIHNLDELYQSAYKTHNSTETALLKVKDDVLKEIYHHVGYTIDTTLNGFCNIVVVRFCILFCLISYVVSILPFHVKFSSVQS